MNEVRLTARLGRDPELRYTASGMAVANLSVAHKYNDITHWFSVVAWADVAKATAENIKKGDLVEITGRLTAREWVDKNGLKRNTVEIVADRIEQHYKRVDITPEQARDDESFSDSSIPF